MTYTLVLVRHGESDWNAKNLFTGWVDVDLTDKGRTEAVRAGQQLREAGILPDIVHTSVQRRAPAPAVGQHAAAHGAGGAADAVRTQHQAGLALAEVELHGQVDGQVDDDEGAQPVDQRAGPEEPELPGQPARSLL